MKAKIVLVLILFLGIEAECQINTGAGSFIYDTYEPLKDKPITVWYYNPAKDASKLKIVFVMHGVQRNGSTYRDNWIELAKEHQFLIVVPEYSEKYYPESESYNMGNMIDDKGLAIEESKWSYSSIEPLFDYIKSITSNTQDSYTIFGHSAGAQFVHRFGLFKPQNRANAIITANAGWYTMPDFNIEFPYGLKNTAATAESLRKSFTRKMIIMLGEEDKDTNHKSLRKTKNAMIQGAHRFERGQNFYQKSVEKSSELNAKLNWEIITVSGAAHENEKMAIPAAQYISKTK
jgi:poly(3-hydroxybutyrate) depolymerase